MRLAAALPVLMLASAIGCAAPLATKVPASSESCEAKVVHAMVSPNKPVAGAYACFDLTGTRFAMELENSGIHDDASLATYAAQDPVYTAAQPCPKQPSDRTFRIYELSNGDNHQAMQVHVVSGGKVDAVNFAGMQSTCADAGAA